MALHIGETHLGVTDIFGEDVGAPLGGVFTCTQGLKTTWNTPLDERGIIGMAMGIAYAGGKPVAEIQFCDYIFNTIDLLKLAGNSNWSTNGNAPMNLVVMTPSGAGIHGSLYHSHSFESIATHLPGWKIVMPSTPKDAYGLMLSAISDPNPVLYLAPKALLRIKGEELIAGEPESEKELKDRIDAPLGDRAKWEPRWPDLQITPIPIGRARRARAGQDAVILTYGRHVALSVAAAESVKARGLGDVEVLDLRTLYPYDWTSISELVRRTGRVLVVNEDTEISNFGEHLIRRIVEEHFYELRARPRLLAGAHVPGIGLAPTLEDVSVPQQATIERDLEALLMERT
jgi:2-oxoisovalerate dehydrogenase E1 component beta subunit